MKLTRPFSALFLAISLSASGSAFAGESIRVVSDLDDTIKITNVDETGQAIWNGLFTLRAFAGMSRLYRAMEEANPDLRFTYLSASNEALRPKVRKFIARNGFPEGQILLKGLLNFGDTAAYKTARIEELFARHPEEKFILIGDDTEHDPGVYDALYTKYPDRILDIYIRRIKGRRLPPAIYPFVTAFDVARMEYEFLRLNTILVGDVAESILLETRDSRVLPAFQACPGGTPLALGNSIDEWDRRIDSRIEKICSTRD